MNVGEILVIQVGVNTIIYEIEAICIGATAQDDLVQLRCKNRKPGIDTEGKSHDTLWVPSLLVEMAPRYRITHD